MSPPDPRPTAPFSKAKQHGFHLKSSPISRSAWRALIRKNPLIPRNYRELVGAFRHLFQSRKSRKVSHARLQTRRLRAFARKHCVRSATPLWAVVQQGLVNPDLTREQKDRLDSLLVSSRPELPETYLTANFQINYIKKSVDEYNGIDPSTALAIGQALETAFAVFKSFGKMVPLGQTPFPGRYVHNVYLLPNPGVLGMTTLNGPTDLDAVALQKAVGYSKSIPQHELFHRVQYTGGYEVTYTDPEPSEWWLEGSASWAPVWVSGIGDEGSLAPMFDSPGTSLYSRSNDAFPFWVFLYGQDPANDNLCFEFLRQYRLGGAAGQVGLTRRTLRTVLANFFTFGSNPASTADAWYINLFYLHAFNYSWLKSGPGVDRTHGNWAIACTLQPLIDMQGEDDPLPWRSAPASIPLTTSNAFGTWSLQAPPDGGAVVIQVACMPNPIFPSRDRSIEITLDCSGTPGMVAFLGGVSLDGNGAVVSFHGPDPHGFNKPVVGFRVLNLNNYLVCTFSGGASGSPFTLSYTVTLV